jgi:hypothetical protein
MPVTGKDLVALGFGPSPYKPAARVRAHIKAFGLADVVDEVVPFGSIMAGDWERDTPWRKKTEAKSRRAAA